MPTPLSAGEVLSREFLEIRARLLQVGAALDRLDRAEGTADDDPRRAQITQALEVLHADATNRAERIQMIFSRPYSPAWRSAFDLANGRH